MATQRALARLVAGLYILGVLAFVPPCSPTTAKTIPAGDAWVHESKLDGYRVLVVKEGRNVRLYSRRGNEWTSRLSGLVDALAELPCRSAILDAELCLPGAGGVPNFYGLQAAMGRRRRDELSSTLSTCCTGTARTSARCRWWSAGDGSSGCSPSREYPACAW